MQMRFEVPDTFWSLFRSVNRDVYIEALLTINEEYPDLKFVRRR